MKKFIFILTLMLVSVLQINAKGWVINNINKDELLNKQETKAYIYKTNNFYYTFFDATKDIFIIESYDKIFNYHYIGKGKYVNAIIGLYDNSNSLLKKYSVALAKSNDHYLSVGKFSLENDIINENIYNPIREINDFLISNKGYMRIVVDCYEDADFDVIIPCINNNSTTSPLYKKNY